MTLAGGIHEPLFTCSGFSDCTEALAVWFWSPCSSVDLVLAYWSSRVQAMYLKLGDILFRFSGFREKFKLGFTFLFMFYTFKLLPQLKIGRCMSCRETMSPTSPSSLFPAHYPDVTKILLKRT